MWAPISRRFLIRPIYRHYSIGFTPKITVIGVGGGGGNAVNHMIASEMNGVNFVACNTDAQALSLSQAANRVRLGKDFTKGLGAGAKPDVGKKAAEADLGDVMELNALDETHLVFIAAGMGGGTGTGAAPVIAKALQEKGVLTVGVVTSPFTFEGPVRNRNAAHGINELQKHVDTLIVINNQKLIEIAQEEKSYTFTEAFKLADDVLHKGVRTITDLLLNPGLVNLDFGDLRTVLLSSKHNGLIGRSLMGTGIAVGENRAKIAASKAIHNRLLDIHSLSGARGVLINISGGEDLSLFEIEEAASVIQEQAHPEAAIIWGAASDSKFNGQISVSVVACGMGLNAH